MKKPATFLIIVLILFTSIHSFSDEKQPINDVYAILFIMDGLNYDTFARAMEKGSAPNIKKYFIDEGAHFTRALTIFPSASSTAYQSFISGLFPGYAGIPYLGWFDRARGKPVCYFTPSGHRHLDHDFLNLKALLDPAETRLYPPSTIFDHLKGHETAAIYSSYNAGAKYRKPKNPVPAMWAVFGSAREEMLDRYAFKEVVNLFRKPLSQIPRFTFVGLYSFDSLGHHFGADSAIIEYNLEQFDNFLAKFIALLKERGLFDKTYIILAADHGMHDTPKSKFNLKEFVGKTGLTLYPGHPRKADDDVYVSSRGISSAHIYIKGEGGWRERPDYNRMRNYPLKSGKGIDIIKTLAGAGEIKFVIVRDGFHKVHVFSNDGHGAVTWYFDKSGTGWYKYDVVAGPDPLELTGDPNTARLVDNGFYSADMWGEATAEHKYPDAVVQLSQIFADGRSGDIFVIPENDWVLYRGKAATHGSIIKEDMHVPFLIRGPAVPTGRFGFARVSDLYPTLLNWFGIEGNEKHYDGRHLFEYRACRPDCATIGLKFPSPSGRGKGRGILFLNDIAKLKKTRERLEMIYSDLEKQKGEPKKYHFTPNLVLDANMWLVNEQLKGIDADVKILLQ